MAWGRVCFEFLLAPVPRCGDAGSKRGRVSPNPVVRVVVTVGALAMASFLQLRSLAQTCGRGRRVRQGRRDCLP
jgi:hypothetical protein